MSEPVLLPRPRTSTLTGGVHRPIPGGRPPVTIVDPVAVPRPEGYRLVVEPDRVLIVARDAAGAFYARRTLAQLERQAGPDGALPCLRIDDAPDFVHRGVLLDVSRDKVPTMETLFAWVDRLADWKINQLQLYVEHTFAYRDHAEVWAAASPLTHDEVAALDAYCRERHVELVPNQNSFGHMERWLVHPRYADLAEVPYTDAQRASGEDPGYRSLCPIDPRSLALIEGLYDELLPLFSSRQVNVGCDETIDLGRGRSREAVAARGAGRVYLEFLRGIHAACARHGRTMMFWGDIVLAHPELIGELPRDAVALDWGYEADHPFDAEGARFARAGIRHYVCPGTSSWLSIGGRTDNAVANLRAAAEHGLAHGAVGYLVTDWGDFGHWQPLPVSWLGLAHGAALAWCFEANRDLDVPRALDAHVFLDAAGVMGRLAWDLGNAYRETGLLLKNRSVLAALTLFPDRPLGERPLAALEAEGLERAAAWIDGVVGRLGSTRMTRADADLVEAEIRNAAALMAHGARIGLARLTAGRGAVEAVAPRERAALADDLEAIEAEFRRLWLLRNRPGGLDDSTARMRRLIRRYRGQSS